MLRLERPAYGDRLEAESATTELTEAAEIFWRGVLSVVRVLRGGEFVAYEMAGFGFSGSTPYVLSASATRARGTAPSLARLSKAASVTQRRSTSKKCRSFAR